MKSLTTVKCLKCNVVYNTSILKLRVQLFLHTYEHCNFCGRWALHKLLFLQVKKPEIKE